MSLTLAAGRPTLVDRVFPRVLVLDLVLIAAGTALTAIAAQISIPLWPVPLTLQTFAVLLVGTTLGPIRGALSMVLYLVVGVLGLPVFTAGAHGSLFALPSGGFIIGFILAAVLVGWLAQRQWDHRVLGTAISFIAGAAVMYIVGLPWLYSVLSSYPEAVMIKFFGTTNVLQATLVGGLFPFIIGDLIKAAAAAILLPLTWRGLARLRRKI